MLLIKRSRNVLFLLHLSVIVYASLSLFKLFSQIRLMVSRTPAQKGSTPAVGLEPTTTRLGASCAKWKYSSSGARTHDHQVGSLVVQVSQTVVDSRTRKPRSKK